MSNEPAFPVPTEHEWTGLSVRDYFAAKAMQGLVDSIKGENWDNITARQAYKVADAMMKARETK